MKSIDQIKSNIQSLPFEHVSRYLNKKEIKALPEIIGDDENITNLIDGSYENGTGLLVATNKRLIFVSKGMLYGLKVEDFPLNKISSIQYNTGLVLGDIKIHTSGNVTKIEYCQKSVTKSFCEFIRNEIERTNQPAKPVAAPPPIPNQPTIKEDPFEKIKKLGKLKEQGLITQEEFDEQKARILNQL